jgi:23S rRNA (guanosine2251-2'-O)-methyltransferase
MAARTEIIYGLHAVRHALEQAPHQVAQLWIRNDKQPSAGVKAIQQLAVASNIIPRQVTADELDQITAGGVHQGVVLYRESSAENIVQDLDSLLGRQRESSPFILILDGVQDPHNLGACVRTANAAGADAVIIPKNRAAGITATVRKVASGAAEVTPVVTVTNLGRCINKIQQAGIWVIGTDGQAEKSLYATDLTLPLALVLGSEGAGLRQNTQKHCDFLINIPMRGSVESLNVSVAAGICMYEALRQRSGN